MDKTQTFAELGIPFPLYEAPVETCSDFVGRGACHLCEREEQWIFRAGIGDDLPAPCPSCGIVNALSCSDKKDGVCTGCETSVSWPLSREGDVNICYDCLRAGRVWFTKDTGFGMVRWEDARRGWTHGVPIKLDVPLESRPKEEDPDWHEYAIAPEDATS